MSTSKRHPYVNHPLGNTLEVLGKQLCFQLHHMEGKPCPDWETFTPIGKDYYISSILSVIDLEPERLLEVLTYNDRIKR